MSSQILFPNPKASYRIRENYSTSDKIYSLLLGFASSVTRKSWIVEECPLVVQSQVAIEVKPPVKPLTESPEFLSSVQAAVDAYQKQKDQEYEEVLDSTIEQNKTNLKLDESLPIIWLRSGEIKQGEVVEQTQDSITIKYELGENEIIPKSKVLRVRYPKEKEAK